MRRSRRDPARRFRFVWQHPAGARLKIHSSVFHGAGAPGRERSGGGLFLGQARPSQHCGLPYLRGPAGRRLLIRSRRERSCRPLGALVPPHAPLAVGYSGCTACTMPYPPPVQVQSVHHRPPLATCERFGLESCARRPRAHPFPLNPSVRYNEATSTRIDSTRLDSTQGQRTPLHLISSHLISAHPGSSHCPSN